METKVPRSEFAYAAVELVSGESGTSHGKRFEVFPYHAAYWVTVNFLIPFQMA